MEKSDPESDPKVTQKRVPFGEARMAKTQGKQMVLHFSGSKKDPFLDPLLDHPFPGFNRNEWDFE